MMSSIQLCKDRFERSNFEIIEAETGEEAIKLAREHKPDIVVLDIMLPGIDGFEVCVALRSEFPRMGIIMLTAGIWIWIELWDWNRGPMIM